MQLIKTVAVKTARGVLSKGWYRINGEIYLVKGNSASRMHGGVSYEPYSEVMASRIANIMGFRHIEYQLYPAKMFPSVKVVGIEHVSVCKLFYLEGVQQYPLYDYVIYRTGDEARDWLEAYSRLVGDMGGLYEYIILDAITGNPDRHLTNIDILVDKKGRTQLFPIFDCGASLLAWASEDVDIKGMDLAEPFKPTHREQIQLVPRVMARTNIQTIFNQILYGISDILDLLPEERKYNIVHYLKDRLPMLSQVMIL